MTLIPRAQIHLMAALLIFAFTSFFHMPESLACQKNHHNREAASLKSSHKKSDKTRMAKKAQHKKSKKLVESKLRNKLPRKTASVHSKPNYAQENQASDTLFDSLDSPMDSTSETTIEDEVSQELQEKNFNANKSETPETFSIGVPDEFKNN